VEVVVGEEARNFDQLKVGDKVNAEYSQALTLTLQKSNAPLTANETQTLDRTPAGAKPGGSASREVTILANVTAVDHKKGVVTLKGPQGNSVDLAVQDPAQIKRIKVGDQIKAVYTEAVAISVEPVASK
jgi:Cu/Ag efflux protein CusF